MFKDKIFNFVFIVLAVIIVLIILVPILKMFMNTDLSILKATIMDDEILNTFFVTAKASFYATIMGVIFGVPMAYILARGNFKGKEILESIVDIPVIVPHSAAGIALLGVVGKKFFFGKLFNNFGLNFVGTEYGIALAMFFVSVPFLINGAKEGFKLVDDRLEFVAMTLGANKFRAFMDITLPLALRSVLSGMIMMWARGISEFGAVIILVYHPMVVSVKIFERFEGYGLNYARPIAVLLILVCLIIFFVLRILIKKKRVR